MVPRLLCLKKSFSWRLNEAALRRRCFKEYQRIYQASYTLNIQPELLFNLVTEKPHARPAPDARIQRFVNDTAYQRPGYYKEAVQITHNLDIDEMMGPILFKFLSSYFDFGLAYWPMPNREKGLWQCFCEIYSKGGFFSTKFLKTLKRVATEMKRYQYDNATALLLQRLVIPDEHLDDYMFRTLYRYKGWVGTIKALEGMPGMDSKHDIKAVFKEVIPVILVLELAAIESICDLQGLKIPVYKPEPLYDPYFCRLHRGRFGRQK